MKSLQATVVFVLTWLVMAVLQIGVATSDGGAEQAADESWQIHGRVVDEQGQPVRDFVAATMWSSNGKQWNERGEWIGLNGYKSRDKYWKEEGVLAAFPSRMAKRVADGEFVATIEDCPRVSVFVTDSQQERGGYASIEKSAADQPVTIMLVPLVRVTGKIYCPQAERTPDWTAAIVHPPGDTENYFRFARCASLKGVFSFLLPPGTYDLEVYSESPDAQSPRPIKREQHDAPHDLPQYLSGLRIEVPADKRLLDLGVLNVEIPEGRGDYSSYYGKEPPALQITDARGISKDVKLADLRGKWVLLDFWRLSCVPCMYPSLPDLAQFYEEHSGDRDRFEILSIFVSDGSKIKTIMEFAETEKPLVEKACSGKPLPFPVLIDGEGKTRAAYGIGGRSMTLLIDPEGHLVKWGDEVMLAEKLKEQQP